MSRGDAVAFYYDRTLRRAQVVRSVRDPDGDAQWLLLDHLLDARGKPQFYVKYPDNCHGIGSLQENGDPWLTEEQAVQVQRTCDALLQRDDVKAFIGEADFRRPEAILVRGRVVRFDDPAGPGFGLSHPDADMVPGSNDPDPQKKPVRYPFEPPMRLTLRDAPTIEESWQEGKERRAAAGKGKAYTTPGADLAPAMMRYLMWDEARQRHFERGLEELKRQGRQRKQYHAYVECVWWGVPQAEYARQQGATRSMIHKLVVKASDFMDRWMGWDVLGEDGQPEPEKQYEKRSFLRNTSQRRRA